MNALESYADRMNYHSHVDCKKFTAVWKTCLVFQKITFKVYS